MKKSTMRKVLNKKGGQKSILVEFCPQPKMCVRMKRRCGVRFLRKLCDEGNLGKAVETVRQMHQSGQQFSAYVFYILLKGCSRHGDLPTARRVRSLMSSTIHAAKPLLAHQLIRLFSGNLQEALTEFHRFPHRDVYMWSAIIRAHAHHGKGQEAVDLYLQMTKTDVAADAFTYVAALNACASIGALDRGRLIHQHVMKAGLEQNIFVGSSLVDMYSKCGSLEEAWEAFGKLPDRDVVCWTAMIDACAEKGLAEEALHLFEQMKRAGVVPNKVTFLCLLKVCGAAEGRLLHKEVLNRGWGSDLELGNALIHMYAKGGDLIEAYRVFSNLPTPNVVSWTTMITGLAQNNYAQAAFEFFTKMQDKGVDPNKVTFVGLLKACCNMAALDRGKLIHAQLMKKGLDSDLMIGNALVDMYAKCGSIADARKLFFALPERDIISWNAMINACAQQGQGVAAIHLFKRMRGENVWPDKITFLSLLLACNHTGMIEEAYHLFDLMSNDFGIMPTMDHYTCMVDILGRTGKLYEAYNFINTIPLQPNAGIWLSLLASCRIHRNLELGKLSFQCLVELEPRNAAAYMLMCSIYSSCGI